MLLYIKKYPIPAALFGTSISLLICGALLLVINNVVEKPGNLKLKALSKNATANGAVCLDGTTPGYYYREKLDKDVWHIHFQGGGWCYNEEHCYQRSFTDLGSSKNWIPRAKGEGILDEDCEHNPVLCDIGLIFLPYCDGTSWSGNQSDPITHNDKKLFFRGEKILTETLKELLTLGLTSAKMIIISGNSAGGTGAELHANRLNDFFHENIPELKKILVISSSGWFANLPNSDGKQIIADQYKNLYHMANSYIYPGACTMTGEEQWKCLFPQYLYPNINPSYFLVESKIDAWSVQCILAADQTGCARTSLGQCSRELWTCTNEQITKLNNFGKDVEETITSSHRMFTRPGNGVFLHTCETHGLLARDYLSVISIGGITMDQAVVNWINSNWNEVSPAQNTVDTCEWNNQTTPRYCNPSCGLDHIVKDTTVGHYISSFFRRFPLLASSAVLASLSLIICVFTIARLCCFPKGKKSVLLQLNNDSMKDCNSVDEDDDSIDENTDETDRIVV